MTRLFATALFLAIGGGTALAQPGGEISITSFDPDNAVAPVSTVEGRGIKVGEGTVLHPVFGMETGVVSNVFYEDSNTNAAGVLRLLAQIGTGSLSRERLTPADQNSDDGTVREGSFQYRASARASYDFIISGNDAATETGGLGLGLSFRGLVNPEGKVSFGFDENFTRLIRAANFETDANTNRDINTLALNLLYHPQSSRLHANAYYANTIDIFERDQQEFADRIQHKIGLRPMFKLFPQTTLFIDASYGFYGGLGDSMKASSNPFAIVGGISTLLTPAITLNTYAGYTYSAYEVGPGYSSIVASATMGYRYSPLGRVAFSYDYFHNDSVNSNFYRDHVIRLWMQHMFNQRIVFMAQPELHIRTYEGIPMSFGGPATRDDLIISVVTGVHYIFRNWIAATLNYRFSSVSTDYRYTTDGITDDPSFARHELLFGLRIAM